MRKKLELKEINITISIFFITISFKLANKS
nr:MAG TPA: hypothetical protein [Caudoviricetes sp.]DAU77701.1 MAG TPA: hypothetical protein [Caudoviricetes sp.]